MNEQEQILQNSTKLLSLSSSSPSSVRNLTVINVIYILGIIFMIIVFIILLWINLYSRRCWCWHDTPVIHRFNRQWLIRRSIHKNTDMSLTKNQRQQRSSNDELTV